MDPMAISITDCTRFPYGRCEKQRLEWFPMNSWWELGEGSGIQGDKMEPWRLICPFCGEKGNFSLEYHTEKKKPNSAKRLNFDLYRCNVCVGFVHVLWSAGEYAHGMSGLYNYKVLPRPLSGKPEPSPNWPDGMTRFWIQAHDSLRNENWDAANLMARSALQFVVREKGASNGNLKEQINDLGTKGVLHPLMQEWAHEVRLLANDSAHPTSPVPEPVTPQDARVIVNYLDLLLFYLYDLPAQISGYRERRGTEPTSP
jgi:hypothetical protein